MNEILDLQLAEYPLKDNLRSQLTLAPNTLKKCFQAAQIILNDTFCQTDFQRVSWYSQEWLQHVLDNALTAFDRACDRWRNLYKDAFFQLEDARRVIDCAVMGNATQEERKDAEALEREARRQIDLLVGQVSQGRAQTEFEFYPYRYFASEGFLPGFNFPRLPVRAYLPAGDSGEFISRPRTVAIRELAPSNVLYYEGNKFQIAKTKISVRGIENNYQRVAVCSNCGYFHEGEDSLRDTCANCGVKFASDSYGNPAKLNRVLPMDTMITRRRERITCDEEERLKYGYNVTTHFRYADLKQDSAVVIAEDGTELLKFSYGETATILRLNRGLRRGQEKGFKLDPTTGIWGERRTETSSDNLQTEVNLSISDTCNILLIEPIDLPEDNLEEFLATLQYGVQPTYVQNRTRY
jgi:hypothetical protein